MLRLPCDVVCTQPVRGRFGDGERGRRLSVHLPQRVLDPVCKRINSKHPDMKMVVGLWTARGDMKQSRQRITCGETAHLVTSLKEALDKIEQITHPAMMRASE